MLGRAAQFHFEKKQFFYTFDFLWQQICLMSDNLKQDLRHLSDLPFYNKVLILKFDFKKLMECLRA